MPALTYCYAIAGTWERRKQNKLSAEPVILHTGGVNGAQNKVGPASSQGWLSIVCHLPRYCSSSRLLSTCWCSAWSGVCCTCSCEWQVGNHEAQQGAYG